MEILGIVVGVIIAILFGLSFGPDIANMMQVVLC